jgi:hypothetical protein
LLFLKFWVIMLYVHHLWELFCLKFYQGFVFA